MSPHAINILIFPMDRCCVLCTAGIEFLQIVSLEFFIDIIFRSLYGPGLDSTSNRNEYQEYFLGGKGGRCLGLTTLPP
jgi:hypothetical protein